MGRDLDGVDQSFSGSFAAVTVVPLTFSIWFRSDVDDAFITLMGLSQGAINDSWSIFLTNGPNLRINARNSGGDNGFATSTTTYSASTWHHALAVFTSNISRHVLLDGGGKGSGTDDRAVAAPNTTKIGTRADDAEFFNGRLGEGGMWDVALSDDEGIALASGVSPLRVRGASLKAYYPLFAVTGNAPDYSGGGNTLTANNAPGLADHAPVAPMFAFDLGWQGAFTVAVAAEAEAAVANYLGNLERHYPRGVNRGVLRGAIR